MKDFLNNWPEPKMSIAAIKTPMAAMTKTPRRK
jgi:hypothetical protein